MKKSSPKEYPNIFTRFFYAWGNPHFLEKTVMKEKTSGRTWGFWFFWNTILTLTITVGLWTLSLSPIAELEKEAQASLPEFTAEMKDGTLSTDLPEPYVLHEQKEGETTLFVIDTKTQTYNQESLANYEVGLIIKSDRVIIKEQAAEYKTIAFNEFGEENIDFTLTKATMFDAWEEYKTAIIATLFTIFGVFLWIFLALIRLITALFWALIFWAAGSLAKIKGWSFGKSYLSVLNLYFIPLILETILLILGVKFMFSTLIFFSLVFGLNFWKMKKAK